VPSKPHGTNAGYQAHIKHKTPPCDECRTAHADEQRWGRYRAAGHRARLIELERYAAPAAPLDPLDELFASLIGALAGAAREAGWY
jgi:hypothetical protein